MVCLRAAVEDWLADVLSVSKIQVLNVGCRVGRVALNLTQAPQRPK